MFMAIEVYNLILDVEGKQLRRVRHRVHTCPGRRPVNSGFVLGQLDKL